MLQVSASRPTGRHSVGFYADEDEFAASVRSYLADGLLAGEVVVVIATGAHQARLDAELRDAGLDLAALRAGARYVTFDAEAALDRFMVDDRPDPARFGEALGTLVATLATRARPVRIYGEMVGVLWEAGNVPAAIELEDLWNELGTTATFQLHCGYELAGTGAEVDIGELRRICDAHTELTTPAWTLQDAGRAAHRGDECYTVLLPSVAAAGFARGVVRQALERWGHQHLVEDLTLIASELVTNAVRHARTPVAVELSGGGATLHLRVHDADTTPPVARRVPSSATGGRGLELVAALADSWGVDLHEGGKCIWAELRADHRRA